MSGRDFQIALVYNLENTIKKGNPKELIALQDTAITTQNLYNALILLDYRTVLVAAQDSLERFEWELSRYSPEDTFVFFNCDGFSGENLGSVRVAEVIERLNFKHTGAPSGAIALCTDKVRAKEHLIEAGVPTPAFQVFDRPGGDFQLNFPVIVKPATEDASLGIDLQSVVTNPINLFERVSYVIENYEQPALVEEFILGRELAISMWGNGTVEVLPPYEEDYSQITDPLQCLLTYEAKWLPESPYYHSITTRCPANLSIQEEQAVRETAVQAFKAIGLRDFGRVDVRLLDGIPYVIDINDLPDLSPDAGFPRNAQSAGYTYPEMVERIVNYALRREGWR
jgi:D-alanine-D-alanine ligase